MHALPFPSNTTKLFWKCFQRGKTFVFLRKLNTEFWLFPDSWYLKVFCLIRMPSFSLKKTKLLSWYRVCIQCPPSRWHISTWWKSLCTSGGVLWAIHPFKTTSHFPGPYRRGPPAHQVTTACCHSTAMPMQQCWGAPCPVPGLCSLHSPSSWTSQFLPACHI